MAVMTIETTLAQNIRKKREKLGITRKALSERLGGAESQVWHWENCRHMPGAYSLCLLADEFGCTVDELLGRGGEDGE